MRTEPENQFTPNEVAVLSGVPVRKIWKDIELKVIRPARRARGAHPKVWLTASDVLYFAAMAGMGIETGAKGRRKLYQGIMRALEEEPSRRKERPLALSRYLLLDIGAAERNLLGRLEKWSRWKGRLVRNPQILGGETVFPNSRLSVRHIGEILRQGESSAAIREDYPYLTDDDLEFARLYVDAEPAMGRPKRRRKAKS